MTSPEWERLAELFDAASRLEPSARAGFLDEHCGGDDALRRELKSLLAYDEGSTLMDTSASELAAAAFVGEYAEMAGRELGHYQIREEVGYGGMGVVYRAFDTKLQRDVALKVLAHELVADETHRRLFENEARAASALNHPNIVTIHDIGEVDGIAFIAMELVEGRTLKEILTSDGPLDLPSLLDVASQTARGLAKAHAAGIVHRDLKLTNVMVTDDGFVKILDFGIATLGGSGSPSGARAAGTRGYMSPEQAEGRSTDFRSDLYALGVVLEEMSSRAAASALQPLLTRCLEPDPARRFEKTEDLVGALDALATSERPSRRVFVLGIVGAAAAAAAVVAAIGLLRSNGERPSVRSIAVLAFTDASTVPDQAYLAEGISDELASRFAGIPTIRVIAPASTRRYRNSDASVAEIARELSADVLVDGTVVRTDDGIRVDVRLIDAADETVTWAESYDIAPAEIHRFHRDVVEEVTRRAPIDATPVTGARRRPAPGAHVAFLKGRHHYLRLTPEDMRLARDYFEEAIAIDADYAEPYAGLAECYLVSDGRMLGLHPVRAYEEARRLAEAALERDETLAKAHTILGGILCEHDRDLAGAEAQFRRAIELNPSNADVHGVYSSCLSRAGRHDAALAAIQEAVSLDPLNPLIASQLGFTHYYARRYSEAEALLREAIELHPDHARAYLGLGRVYAATGRPSHAVATLEEQARLSRTEASPWLGYAYALAGRSSEAADIRARLEAEAETRFVSPHDMALVDIGLGETGLALDGLEKTFEVDPVRLSYLSVDTVYDPLRDEPRFQVLERSVRR